MSITRKNAPPAPEKIARGSASASSRDTVLERLEADAARTGNRTPVIEYRRSKARK